MTSFILIVIVILFALLGAPLFAVIAAAAMIGFHSIDVDFMVIAVELYRIADTPVLLALPLFTLAGYLLGESRTSQRLVRLTRAFIGWLPNGLAVVSFVACALFTAFTGASGVTIVALGALLYPSLTREGYPDRFSIGLVTTSGSLGILIAPSIPLILYGIIAQQSGAGAAVEIKDLFLAGLIPSLLMIILLVCYSIWANRGQPIHLTGFEWKEALSAIREAAWEIPLPFFVLGGIYGGFFAVSETAAVTAVYVLIVEVLIYRDIDIRKLPAIMRESMVMVGGILLILGVSLASTNFLIDAQVPMKIFTLIQTHVSGKLTFLLLLNVLLLVVGALLDVFSALIILVPLILPVALQYGVDPVHLGIIFLANMQIGYFTPPVGMGLFIGSYRFGKPVVELYRACIPYILVLFAAVLMITYWPDLSLMFIGK